MQYPKVLKKLKALEPMNAPKLDRQIYDKILLPAENFRPENKDEFKEGIELLGKLMVIHREYEAEAGEFGDMFGSYLEFTEQLSGKWGGQFFTPIHICDAIVVMTLGDDLEGEPHRCLDPAAGTGRFMLRTAKHYAEKVGQFNFIFTNIDIDFRVFVYSTMIAILKGIPSVNIHGNTLSNKFWDAFATIPTFGISQWVRVDPKLLEEQFNRIFEASRPKKGLEIFIDEKVKTHRPREVVSKFVVKPDQKTLFGE